MIIAAALMMNTTTFDADLQAQLLKIAKSDLARAKRNGTCMVCKTKRGNVEIKHVDGTFTLTKCGNLMTGDLNVEQLATGSLKEVAPILAGLYVVTY